MNPTTLDSGSLEITYDPAGNRLSTIDPLTQDITTYTYDDSNQLLTAEDASGETTYTYDARGNRLTIEEPNLDVTTNTWDGENRLVKVEHPDSSVVEYDGDGLRVAKTIDSVDVTKYVFDGNNVLRETDDTGTTEADFTYRPAGYGLVIGQRRGIDSSYYHFDGVHNVRLLTDGTATETDDYDFDAFGKQLASTGASANSQRYKGRFLAYHQDPDAATEPQYSLHHRHYDPQTGIFSSRDPARDDSNLYRYVRNNPINEADPSGLEEPGNNAEPDGDLDLENCH